MMNALLCLNDFNYFSVDEYNFLILVKKLKEFYAKPFWRILTTGSWNVFHMNMLIVYNGGFGLKTLV